MEINLMLGVACTVVACATPAAPPAEETTMSQDHAEDMPPLPQVAVKRRAPPKVPGVTLEGIRYEQAVLARGEADGGQRTGYLAAYRGASDERLWRLRVYELKMDAHLEGDVQDVYFKSMVATPDGHGLLIENERGDRFAVNVRTQAVRKLD